MRKIINLLFIFILFFSFIINEKNIMAETENTNKSIINIDVDEMPEGAPGDKIKITLNLSASKVVKNLNVSPILSEGSQNQVFYPAVGSLSQYVDELNTKSKSIEFQLEISKNAECKIYPLTLSLSYSYIGNGLVPANETKIIYIKVYNKLSLPNIIVDNIWSSENVIRPGTEFILIADIKNNGEMTAKGVKASLIGLKEKGFAIRNDTDSINVEDIAKNNVQKARFFLKANSVLDQDNPSITLRVQYKDNNGRVYTEESNIILNVGNKENDEELIINGVSIGNTPIQQDENFNFTLSIVNSSDKVVKNVKTLIKASENLVALNDNGISVGEIKAKESKIVTFPMKSLKIGQENRGILDIEVKYEVLEGNNFVSKVVKKNLGVYIASHQQLKVEDKGEDPRLVIDKYNIEPGIVKSGDNIKINLSFINLNNTKPLKNIKISLNEKDNQGVFLSFDNIFYINELMQNRNVEKQISMKVSNNAKTMNYIIYVNFEYEDFSGNKYKNVETIQIPVEQASRIQISDINITQNAIVDKMVPISISLYNTGKESVKNLLIKVEGDFNGTNKSKLIKNLDSGGSDVFEVQIIPKNIGNVKGTIVYSYEEQNGEYKEYKKEFTIKVATKSQFVQIIFISMGSAGIIVIYRLIKAHSKK